MRAHYRNVIQDTAGNISPGASVAVYQPGTTVPVTATLFADGSSGTTLSNPFITSDGSVNFYLASPQRVDIGVTAVSGFQIIFRDMDVEAPAANSIDWANLVTDFGADPTGGTAADAPLASALSSGGPIYLPAGIFKLSGSAALTLAVAGTRLFGAGAGLTRIQIGSGFTGPQALAVTGDSCEIGGLAVVGTSTTVASNPSANAIKVTGSQHVRLQDLWFQYINGWAIEAAGAPSRGSLDLLINRIVGRNLAGGIHCLGVTGSSFLGEYFLTDIQLQQMGTASGPRAGLDALLIEDCTDVLVQGVNIGTAASTVGGAIHVKGACATVKITNLDVGTNTAAGVAPAVFIESGANGAPTDVSVINGGAEGGVATCRVDAGNDITLTNLRVHQAYSTGLVINGGDVLVQACSMAANNQSGGTGYDVDTSGMASGNARLVACRMETSIGTATPGSVPQSVNTSTHGYYKSCFFIGTGSAPSNVFTGTPQQVTECVGYNPRGQVTAASIGASPFTPGGYQTPLMVIFTAINGMTAFAIGGVSVGLPAAGVPFIIGVRQTMTITWATTVPTYLWFGL